MNFHGDYPEFLFVLSVGDYLHAAVKLESCRVLFDGVDVFTAVFALSVPTVDGRLGGEAEVADTVSVDCFGGAL